MYLKSLNVSENVLKRIKIFKKASNHFKKASHSLKISFKCHTFFKKKPRILKKELSRIATMASLPLSWPLVLHINLNDLIRKLPERLSYQ
jgi:hypothetical protein